MIKTFMLSFLSTTLVLVVFFLIKNFNTYKNQVIIVEAIYKCAIDCISNHKEPFVDYSEMEDYDSTLFRFWDWGYTRILPKEKYEIIKPYVERRR